MLYLQVVTFFHSSAILYKKKAARSSRSCNVKQILFTQLFKSERKFSQYELCNAYFYLAKQLVKMKLLEATRIWVKIYRLTSPKNWLKYPGQRHSRGGSQPGYDLPWLVAPEQRRKRGPLEAVLGTPRRQRTHSCIGTDSLQRKFYTGNWLDSN